MEQQITVLPRTRRTSQQIRNLLTEFAEGGYTVKEFCQIHDMSSGTFHKWQSRHGNKPSEEGASPGFAELSVLPSFSGVLFAEVNGIRLYQPVAASFLKELLP